MNYKVLYRKYRPSSFKNIIGQDYIVNILQNAITNNKIAHAYIFNGPRGTGKTSTAKVFAKTINCMNPSNSEACNECEACKNLNNNPDIIEIDAASNNGVDEIRELINNIKMAPTFCKYKVYIIDEVHMMTQSAFNALLMTLEEPPSHVVFILATTNIENVPITILSRCQKFDFKKIKINNIIETLSKICDKENINISLDAIKEIAYIAEGGMRDALSILDQISSQTNEISLEDVIKNFNTVPSVVVREIVELLYNNEKDKIINKLTDLKKVNTDYKIFLKRLIEEIISKTVLEDDFIIYEKNKELVFELVEIINNYNINIDPYILIELVLMKYISKNNSKIISREIILEEKNKFKNNNNEETKENNSFEDVKKIIKEELEDVPNNENLIKIRINNCFVNAKRQYLNEAKTKIKNLLDESQKNSLIYSVLIDAEIVAASDKVYIFSGDNDSIVNLINLNLNMIEEKLGNINIIAIEKDNWLKEKEIYIKNIKDNYIYEYIEEENKKIENNVPTNDSKKNIKAVAEEIFSNSKIEIN